jgi:hypothetical protein
VAVVVEIGHAGAPLDVAVLHPQARSRRDVFEQTLAEIAVKRGHVIGEVRLQQVQPAVDVEISNGQPHPGLGPPVLAERRTAAEGNVGERAVMIVPVQNGRR